MFPNLRVVCFDLDNTLWDVDPVIRAAEAHLYEWLREHYPRIPERWTSDQMRQARMVLAREEAHRAHDFTWLRTESLARHAREVGYGEEAAQRAFDVFFEARNRVVPFADVRPSLEQLRSRFRIASLSNGNSDLVRIGLASVFDLSLAAGTLGVAKPQARAFLAVADRMQCAPGEVLYVGDDPHVDVVGARAAGLRTAWIDRAGSEWPADVPRADIEVRDCAELARRLAPPEVNDARA